MIDTARRHFLRLAVSLFGLLYSRTALANELQVLTREQWGARPTKPVTPLADGVDASTDLIEETALNPTTNIRYITVHHTARPARRIGLSENLKQFQSLLSDYKIDLGNNGIRRIRLADLPYHFFVDVSGEVGEGRPTDFAAYSNTRYSTPIEQHITVVLDGNFEKGAPTDEQVSGLIQILRLLTERFGLSPEDVKLHKEVAATACPGVFLESRIEEIRRQI